MQIRSTLPDEKPLDRPDRTGGQFQSQPLNIGARDDPYRLDQVHYTVSPIPAPFGASHPAFLALKI